MKNRLIALLVLFTVIFFSTAQAQTTARKFEAGKNTFLLDGKPFVVKAAELHYTRIPQAYWEHRIEMCKALGIILFVFIFSGISMNRKKESSIFPVRMILQLSAVRHRNTVCMSLSVLVRMYVRSGRWGDFPGGC